MDNLTNEENLVPRAPARAELAPTGGKAGLPGRPWLWLLLVCLLGAGAWYYF